MNVPAPDLLAALLRDVSRSFYVTLQLLPGAVRRQIGLAYLLARATDTIADTEALPLGDRLNALGMLRDRILGSRDEPVDFRDLAASQVSVPEAELLRRIEEAVALLRDLPCFDRCCIREVVGTITSGQELDLQRFEGASGGRVVALLDDSELDDYTFRVAGCVGGFWTRICRSHLFPKASVDLPAYLEDAVRFGKGLQLVNILRDLPLDLRRGRCYLPAEGLRDAGLKPVELAEASVMPRFRPLYRRHLERAAQHLAAGWRYTCATPRSQYRIRVACALPLLIGIETLRLLAVRNVLDASCRIKISRARVKALLLRAALTHPFPRCWESLFRPELPTEPC